MELTNTLQLLNQNLSWASKFKLNRSDFIVSGAAALSLHGLLSEDNDSVALYAKRKTYAKFAGHHNTTYFDVSDNIRIYLSNEVYDTVLIDGHKVLSLNQIVKDLQAHGGFPELVAKAKAMLSNESSKADASKMFTKPSNGVNQRKRLEQRLRKQGRLMKRKGWNVYEK